MKTEMKIEDLVRKVIPKYKSKVELRKEVEDMKLNLSLIKMIDTPIHERLNSRVTFRKEHWTPEELKIRENKWKLSLVEKLVKGLIPYVYFDVVEDEDEKEITASIFVTKVVNGGLI